MECGGAYTGPIEETCDGIDEDCDGIIDNTLIDCACEIGEERECGTDTGICASGTQICIDNTWGYCIGDIEPITEELCNGLDDDCDGFVDEEINSRCGSDIGECMSGIRQCINEEWSECVQDKSPTAEICDGFDNDCDGEIDEGLADCHCDEGRIRSCGTDKGICISGTQKCVDDRWSQCSGDYVGPSNEICNDFDDDCDGRIDEDITMICGSDVGYCTSGIKECSFGSWLECGGSYIEPIEETCDGIDEDCDGIIDNGLEECTCETGYTRECGTDIGICSSAQQICIDNIWQACEGDIEPIFETCNGLDDDCDGFVDDGLFRPCGTDVGACMSGIQGCSEGIWNSCIDEVGPISEECNGIDDDCNGMIDDGLPLCFCTNNRHCINK